MQKEHGAEWVAVGILVAPFGLRGELKVRSLTDIPDRFSILETVYLGPDYTPRRVLKARPYKGDMFVLQLEGISDATAAESLRNIYLYIPLNQLLSLPLDSYYQHDILGLRVMTLARYEIGTIVDIIVTGGNDVYVLKTHEGEQVLIPAIKDVIKQVDLADNIMYIDPMSGLLDDQKSSK